MVQLRTAKQNRFRRDAWIEINLENLELNLREIYASVQKPLMPIVKADAYGHGASIISPILEAYDYVWGFGVASMDEALSLREAGIKKDILILGISPIWSFESALKNNISLTIVDRDSLEELNKIAGDMNLKAKVHLKVETGLNRIGFEKNSLLELLSELKSDAKKKFQNVDIEYLFSHFANPADEGFSQKQYDKFDELTKQNGFKRHMASTAAARLKPESRFDLVRCGIELYGLDALPSATGSSIPVRPLLSLYSRINYLKNVEAGQSVSYRSSITENWTAKRDSTIATLPLGYADGVPRALSNKMKAFIKGKEVDQVGLITMDQFMIDVTDLGEVKVGEPVELIGPHVKASDWALALDTISYEIVTNLNLRLPKIYTRPE